MPFYLRKSLKAGPLRFNFSKSGIGVSAGVKGLRVGSGPRGNYIHAGRHGIYYRSSLLSRPSTEDRPESVDGSSPDQELRAIESSHVLAFTDSSSQALLDEIRAKRSIPPIPRYWAIASGIGVVMLSLMAVPSAVIGVAGVLVVVVVQAKPDFS